jgi:GntR family transcriptional regulator
MTGDITADSNKRGWTVTASAHTHPGRFSHPGVGNDGAILSGISAAMEIDFSSSVPLHEQVAAALRRAISDGEAVPGDRLPPARDLAAVLGVNTNTVFRAFRTLRDEGLLDFSRGRHVAVTGDAPDRGAIVAKAKELVDLGRRLGYRHEELVQIMERMT